MRLPWGRDPKRPEIPLSGQSGAYIIVNCRLKPELYWIQNPAKRLTFELMTKGLQHFLPLEEGN